MHHRSMNIDPHM